MARVEPKVEFHADVGRLQAAADNPDKVHFIVQVDRLGSRLFCVKLEYEHYPPRSGTNKYYDFHMLKWPIDPETDKPMLMWFVVGIPKKDFHVAEQVAKEVGLKIKPSVPVMYFGSHELVFPMHGDNCYTIESGTTSLIYKNDRAEIERQRAVEFEECEKIVKADEDKLRIEFAARGYGQDQIERILAAWNSGDASYNEVPDNPEVADGQHRMKDKQ